MYNVDQEDYPGICSGHCKKTDHIECRGFMYKAEVCIITQYHANTLFAQSRMAFEIHMRVHCKGVGGIFWFIGGKWIKGLKYFSTDSIKERNFTFKMKKRQVEKSESAYSIRIIYWRANTFCLKFSSFSMDLHRHKLVFFWQLSFNTNQKWWWFFNLRKCQCFRINNL